MLIYFFVITCTIKRGLMLSEGLEPICLSRFDFDYKVLSKLVALETTISELRQTQATLLEETQNIKDSELSTQKTMEALETTLADVKGESFGTTNKGGSTYIRWGRTLCPENGTELIYTGYTAGSRFNQKGSGSNYLCLTNEPLWNKYSDGREYGALVYGTGYEYEQRSSSVFDESLDEFGTPCSACWTKRASVIMIPGRNMCFQGWTMEYHGYLFAGPSGYDVASEFICVDSDAEKGERHTSKGNSVLDIAEARCGTLPCPPYVDGRELTCVVCSK